MQRRAWRVLLTTTIRSRSVTYEEGDYSVMPETVLADAYCPGLIIMNSPPVLLNPFLP